MRREHLGLLIVGAVLLTVMPGKAAEDSAVALPAVQVVQVGGTAPAELQPRYSPAPPEEESWYNSDYLFAFTRGLAGSTLHPVAKAPLFVVAIPLDIAFLPFAAVGGLFG